MKTFVLIIGILVLASIALAVAVAHSLSNPKDNKDYKGEYTALICNICLALGVLTGFLIGYDAGKKANNDDKIETNNSTKMLIINDSIVVPIQPMSSRIIVLDTNEE